jgi:hypothetical protein
MKYAMPFHNTFLFFYKFKSLRQESNQELNYRQQSYHQAKLLKTNIIKFYMLYIFKYIYCCFSKLSMPASPHVTSAREYNMISNILSNQPNDYKNRHEKHLLLKKYRNFILVNGKIYYNENNA